MPQSSVVGPCWTTRWAPRSPEPHASVPGSSGLAVRSGCDGALLVVVTARALPSGERTGTLNPVSLPARATGRQSEPSALTSRAEGRDSIRIGPADGHRAQTKLW